MATEAEDARRRLYTPPVMMRLELHHPDDDHEPATVAPRVADAGEVCAADAVDRRTATAASSDQAAAATPTRIIDRGCLLPCFPACHAPVYRAGHVITGHLLVRPLTRLLISG